MSKIDSTRDHLIETYRKRARHYDITSQLYYPQRAHRRRAVQALRLRPGDSVVEIACGTGVNFPLIEQEIGPEGRIVGVDLTDAMLAQAEHRIETNGWSNVSLVQADAAEFEFPTGVDAILATYAHSLLPKDAMWAAFAIGRWEFPMLATAWFLGGHVRVGMEDNVYLSKGQLTPSNAALCEKAVRILDDLGAELASAKEARQILGLRA